MFNEEAEVIREPNPWEGITFIASAVPESRFALTFSPDGRKKNRITAYFPSIQEAVTFRDRLIEDHKHGRTRETATYPKNYETRLVNA